MQDETKLMQLLSKKDSPILVQLDNGTWIYCSPLYLFEDNNSNAPLKKGGRGYGFFTSEE